MAISWPIDGVLQYVRHPRWWGWPLATIALAWIAILAAFAGVVAWQWPDPPEPGFWARMWHVAAILWTLVKAGAAALALYLTVLPLLTGLACERLAVQVQRAAGATPLPEEPLLRSLGSTLRVVAGTLPMRLGWMAAGLAALFLGPLGFVVGAYGMARVAVVDALDVGLAMRGIPGRERLRILGAHRGEIVLAALPAGLMNIGLGLTFVGWLLWLPGLVAGAARTVLDWPEVRDRRPPEPPAIPVEPLRIAGGDQPPAPPP